MKHIYKLVFVVFLFVFSTAIAQEEEPTVAIDSITPLPYNFNSGQYGGLFLDGSNVEVIYDQETGKYIFVEKIGDYLVKRPIYMTAKEYEEYRLKRDMLDYYKSKISAIDGKKKGSDEAKKDLLPKFYINSKFFESIFGSNEIEVNAQGNVLVKFGILYQKTENPQISERNRSSRTFDFDQQISASINAKVGTRLNVNINYDTQSTFGFQNLIKLEYAPTEDDIIQKIEVGNVSMPLQSSLITGAQNLFGFKTKLQFGATEVTAVFAKQQSQTRSVAAQGGATIQEFELKASDYDKDRHFFLSQKFRNNYDSALENFPLINSAVNITRVEMWITNSSTQTENVRNIVAIADLAEGNAANFGNPGAVLALGGQDPFNEANNLNSLLTEDGLIRKIATVPNALNTLGNFSQGTDYSVLENARKLVLGTDFSLNPQLGFISLNRTLGESEVLAVAYEYTENGIAYQVGELSDNGIVAPDNLVVKLLRPEIITTNIPLWNLMMKNVYGLGAFQMEQDGFRIEVLYQDNTTGVPLNILQSAETPGISTRPLLNLFDIDRLDQTNNETQGGDGFFDYVEGVTVNSQKGLIYFPTVEPFGSHLDGIQENGELTNTADEIFIFRELYDRTQSDAQNNFQSKDKYILKGFFKSNGQNGIPLGAFNVPRGSVNVTTGGRVLVEGVDYVVDYQIGNVQIINPSLISSNAPIQVSVETNNAFSTQNRRFWGVDVQHKFSENFAIGGTFLNLREKPFTQKAQFGSEPVNNSIAGFNLTYSTEVPKLTKWVNYLPNIDTDAPSNFSIRAEAAYLFPNSPKGIELNGEATSYLDDFEGTQIPLNIDAPIQWHLASMPQERADETTNPPTGDFIYADTNETTNLKFGNNRSKLAWYAIDRLFYGSSLRPGNIDDNELSRAEVRRVGFEELFPNEELDITQSNVLRTFDLAYYPEERGTYNFDIDDVDNNTGKFTNPEERWGGVMRSLTTTDFEQANVEYIQFWMMDPFENYSISETEGGGALTEADKFGELYFNLGNISEDVLQDGRKMFENGLPEDGVKDDTNVDETDYSSIPLNQALLNAFTENEADRNNQDVGLDGRNDQDETVEFASFLSGLTGQAQTNAQNDPATDNYEYFRGNRLDGINASILTRYKNFNRTQGNSPTIDGSPENFPSSATQFPDTEDLNRDQTMSTAEGYYQYKIPISPTELAVGQNNIVDSKTSEITLQNGSTQQTTWYQFRIPVQSIEDNQIIGEISSFNSIRFMRIFLTKFKKPIVLRFGRLELVRGNWRRYTKVIEEPTPPEPVDLTAIENQNFEVGVVNIQENENRQPIPYVLPPGVERERLQGSTSIQRQNEQSLTIKVTDLPSQQTRVVFKNTSFDMRMFKKFKLFIHTESITGAIEVGDGDLSAVIRLGSDIIDNYYLIEVPLNVTAGGTTSPEEIWKNNVNAALEEFGKLRLERFESGGTPNVLFPANGKDLNGYKLYVKGNPTLGKIKTMMLGVKNTSATTQSAELWFNEMRVVDFDNEGGWSAVVNANANLADFADFAVSGRASSQGFGSLDQRVGERSQEDTKQYDIVSNFQVGQLLPKNYGIRLPLNVSLSEEFKDPKYDPQYTDVLFEDTNDTNSPNRSAATDYTKRRSISLINVGKDRTNDKKKQYLYDVENLSVSFAYNDTKHTDYNVEKFNDQNVRASASYNYSFQPKNIEPFKKSKFLGKSKYLDLIRDFNINLFPSSISANSNIIRAYNEQLSRPLVVGTVLPPLPTLERRNYAFDWDYSIAHDLTKSLQFNFRAANSFINDEFEKDPNNNSQVINGQIFDKFFTIGRPDHYQQKLDVTYKVPIDKIPLFDFVTANYNYTADFDWQATVSSTNSNFNNIGNTIQNANTHTVNADLNMNKLYKKIGVNKLFRKKGKQNKSKNKKNNKKKGESLDSGLSEKNAPSSEGSIPSTEDGKKLTQKKGGRFNRKKLPIGKKIILSAVDVLTSIKKVRAAYSENNGTLLPGYRPEIGFLGRDNYSGSLAPTLGFVFGDQQGILNTALNNNWLISRENENAAYFSKTYSNTHFEKLDINMDLKPFKNFNIELIANKTKTRSISKQLDVLDSNPFDDNPGVFGLSPITEVGNFAISTFMFNTAFTDSDELFNEFLASRSIIAQRLANSTGKSLAGFSNGNFNDSEFTNQSVLLPAFLATYTGKSANSTKLGAFRDIPIPNWRVSYKGLSKLKWFKKRFKTVTLEHRYQSAYSILGFNSNLQFGQVDFDAVGNHTNRLQFQGVNLVEQFSPLIKVDVKLKNSFSFRAEFNKDRSLNLNFANTSITEIKGEEYVIGLGYKIKDVKWRIKTGATKTIFKGDVNLKADFGLRDNITNIRSIQTESNQITGGQRILTIKFTADYNLNKNLMTSFFYDQNSSRFKISTTFPRNSISAGISIRYNIGN